MNLPSVKLLASAIIFLFGFLSVLSPLVVVDSHSDATFSIGNMMASGVLLAAGLTHMLADASSTLDRGGPDDDDDGYPWSMLIAGCTFIAFLILEESVHLMLSGGGHHHKHEDGDGGLGGSGHSHYRSLGVCTSGHGNGGGGINMSDFSGGSGVLARRSCRGSILLVPRLYCDLAGSDHNSQNHRSHTAPGKPAKGQPEPADVPLPSPARNAASAGASEPATFAPVDEGQPLAPTHSSRRQHRQSVLRMLFDSAESMTGRNWAGLNLDGHGDADANQPPRKSTRASFIQSLSRSLSHADDIDHHHHHHDDHLAQHLHGSAIASLVLLLALCLHSVLAGLSIGIVSSTSEITSIAVAIIAHKVFAGYALGSAMATSEFERSRHAMLGLAFGFSTPLGIYVGMGLNALAQGGGSAYDDDSTAVGVVKAVVAGTFLYVAIVEVGMKELLVCRQDVVGGHDEGLEVDAAVRRTEALKLIALLVGFLAMSGLAAYI